MCFRDRPWWGLWGKFPSFIRHAVVDLISDTRWLAPSFRQCLCSISPTHFTSSSFHVFFCRFGFLWLHLFILFAKVWMRKRGERLVSELKAFDDPPRLISVIYLSFCRCYGSPQRWPRFPILSYLTDGKVQIPMLLYPLDNVVTYLCRWGFLLLP
jgi:hypothetical protein